MVEINFAHAEHMHVSVTYVDRRKSLPYWSCHNADCD